MRRCSARRPAHLPRPGSCRVEADTGRADFRGAAFQNASVEFHEYDHPARVATRQHEQAVYAWLRALTNQLQPDRGDQLAAWLHLLITGMYRDAAILGAAGPAAHGRTLAEQLIATTIHEA
jgi:hypothetical protein